MKSISHTQAFEIKIPVDELFPLFSPEGEKRWVPGWDYETVTENTGLSEDFVFLTRSHDHADTEAIWIVKRYEPQKHWVQYYKIEPGFKLGVITVKCEKRGPFKTRVRVTYQYQALTLAGERFITGLSKQAYDLFIRQWKKLLLNYFKDRG